MVEVVGFGGGGGLKSGSAGRRRGRLLGRRALGMDAWIEVSVTIKGDILV